MKKLIVLIVLITLFSAAVFAEEKENKPHGIFIGFDPLFASLRMIQAEVSIPVTGLFELGAQCRFIDLDWVADVLEPDAPPMGAYIMQLTGVARIFPSQTADAFFFSARFTYLSYGYYADSKQDMDILLGMDVGWRWRWWINNFGIIFQVSGGVERAMMLDILKNTLPVLPTIGFHLGLCF